jgi:hypothetical protein
MGKEMHFFKPLFEGVIVFVLRWSVPYLSFEPFDSNRYPCFSIANASLTVRCDVQV